MAIRMLKSSIGKGLEAKYILADSWFFNHELVSFAKREKVHLISRPKFNNWSYQLDGQSFVLKELARKIGRSLKRTNSRILHLQHSSVTVLYQGEKIKLHFYRSLNSSEKWRVLATTDLSLSAIKCYELYQNRWAIEVSFKELKQHLGYGKCQSRDFDAQIADMSIALMAYNHLSQFKTIHEHQSIGALFDHVSRNWQSPTTMEIFWNKFYEAVKAIAKIAKVSAEKILENYFQGQNHREFRPIFNALVSTET